MWYIYSVLLHSSLPDSKVIEMYSQVSFLQVLSLLYKVQT